VALRACSTEWRTFTPATYTTDWSGPAVARELYDHRTDGGEDNNICFVGGAQGCGQSAGIAAPLAAQLKAGWRAALPGAPAGAAVL
jgi:hypothetical protein